MTEEIILFGVFFLIELAVGRWFLSAFASQDDLARLSERVSEGPRSSEVYDLQMRVRDHDGEIAVLRERQAAFDVNLAHVADAVSDRDDDDSDDELADTE